MKLEITVQEPGQPETQHFKVNILWDRTVAIRIPAEDEKKWRPILELQLRNSGYEFQWLGALVIGSTTHLVTIHLATHFLKGLMPSITEVTLIS